MKILVLGASGQVGNLLMKIGERSGHSMVGTYRHHPQPNLLQLDLCDPDTTRRLVQRAGPDWVVDCACWAWVDGNEREPERAQRENVDTVDNAIAATAAVGARWCYLSSSYVFDGTKSSPYDESDPVSPVSVYAHTKVRAEELSRARFGDDALIARTIVVWGPDPQEKNFAYQLVRNARSSRTMPVPSDQLGNPTFGPDLAAAVLGLIERSAGGIWNVAGPETDLDRATFARSLCRGLGLDDSFIEPVTTDRLGQVARRPLNGALATAMLEGAGLSIRDTVEALAAWRAGEWDWPWADL